jgi:hypothetical protein
LRIAKGKGAILDFRFSLPKNYARKKAALRRVKAVRLGGGGNEACPILATHADREPVKVDQSRQRASAYCFISGKSPGLVLPADRLRAALPVGTNRAPNICIDDQRLLLVAHFITTPDPLAKLMPKRIIFKNRYISA